MNYKKYKLRNNEAELSEGEYLGSRIGRIFTKWKRMKLDSIINHYL